MQESPDIKVDELDEQVEEITRGFNSLIQPIAMMGRDAQVNQSRVDSVLREILQLRDENRKKRNRLVVLAYLAARLKYGSPVTINAFNLKAVGKKPQSREQRIWHLVSDILNYFEPISEKGDVDSNLIPKFWEASCCLAKEFVPALANPTAQKQLYKELTAFYIFSEETNKLSTLSLETYFQKEVLPVAILEVLSATYLSEPRYVRIGKSWITDQKGTKLKVPAASLEASKFIKWLQAEILGNISRKLLARSKNESSERKLENAVEHAPELEQQQDTVHDNWGDPPNLSEENLLENRFSELLSKLQGEATPQGKKYIEGLQQLIDKGTDPSNLDDHELSALLDITPQRIRQLRSAFRKIYK